MRLKLISSYFKLVAYIFGLDVNIFTDETWPKEPLWIKFYKVLRAVFKIYGCPCLKLKSNVIYLIRSLFDLRN